MNEIKGTTYSTFGELSFSNNTSLNTQTLESDMLIAQSMVASRYTHFKKESLEWQRSLSFVSDVMAMLNGIQVGSPSRQLLTKMTNIPSASPLYF